jgi:hypothetical protein
LVENIDMEPGICKLCDKHRDLCDSHYVPAVVYKYSRGKELTNPNPVMLRGDSPKQGTIQARDYVFCEECERRLNENGERWISKIIPDDYGAPFPLLEALKKANPVTREPGRVRLSTVGVRDVEIEKLLYFAASVFWRGAVHEWPDFEGCPVPTLDLGDHRDRLKLYLRGEQPFPSDLYITVMLWPFEKVPPGLIFPDTYPNATWKRLWFYISGIGFVLDVGSKVPEDVREYSTSGSAQRLVTIDEQFGAMVWETIKAMVGDVSRFGALIREIAAVRAKEKPSG